MHKFVLEKALVGIQSQESQGKYNEKASAALKARENLENGTPTPLTQAASGTVTAQQPSDAAKALTAGNNISPQSSTSKIQSIPKHNAPVGSVASNRSQGGTLKDSHNPPPPRTHDTPQQKKNNQKHK